MLSLDQILDGLVVDVAPFALCEVRGDGSIEMGRPDTATLHYVLAGAGVLRVSGWSDIPVSAGQVLVTPPAHNHRLAAGGSGPCELPACGPLGADWTLRRAGSGAGGVLVACGRVQASYQNIAGIFDFLQEPIVADIEFDSRLRQTLEHLIDEIASPRPGAAVLARALMQECLVLLLRHHCREDQGWIPWMAAAQDERLWAAVGAIFAAPAAPHTLESLAARANMSRSAFAEHFRDAFGRGPIDLVKEARLRQAARLLIATDASVKSVARQVGYTSRSYFTRAFADVFGTSPARFRAESRSESAP